MNKVTSIWENISTVSDPPNLTLLLVCFAIAIVLVVTPAWSLSRNIITVAHEGGHALIAKLTFRQVSGIKLNANTSGVTITKGKQYGIGAILTTVAGYIAPALLALGMSYLLSLGYIRLTLLIVGILLILMLIMIRNIWGLLIVAPLVFGAYYAYGQTEVLQLAVLTFLTVFLIVGSLKPIIELYIQRYRGGDRNNDADQLRRLTLLPYHFWILFFLIVTLLADGLSLVLLFKPLL